jgi:hypothetical protein
MFKKLAAIVFFIVVALYLAHVGQVAEVLKQATVGDKACHRNWKLCKDNKDLVDNNDAMLVATSSCKAAAEQRARYGAPQWPWMAFSNFPAGDDFPKRGMLVLNEPDAQFPNQDGAMQHARVRCIYSLETMSVADVEMY